MYTTAQRNRIVAYAIQAAKAAADGQSTIALGEGKARQTLKLREGGMCARFVRQVHETALGLEPSSWPFAARNAYDDSTALRAAVKAGRAVQIDRADLQPGDIVTTGDSAPGHIAIYIGLVNAVRTVAENTSSATRGTPRRAGTKLSPLHALSDENWAGFRLWQPAVPTVVGIHGDKHTARVNLVDGALMAPVRDIAEACGCVIAEWDAQSQTATIAQKA
jgi:hypothetical protein